MLKDLSLIRSNYSLTFCHLYVMCTLFIRYLHDRVQIEYATINCLNFTFQHSHLNVNLTLF